MTEGHDHDKTREQCRPPGEVTVLRVAPCRRGRHTRWRRHGNQHRLSPRRGRRDEHRPDRGQRSLEAYERFGEKFRTDIGLRQVGYLFLCRSEAELLQVEDSTRNQNRLGGSSRMVSPDDAHRINPFLEPRALVAASYSPRDGFAQPSRVVQAYAEAAQQLGVTICQDTEILDIEAAGGEVRAVHTNRGSIRTSTVICAAGVWSTRLGAMAGVHLPIEPVRRQIGMTPQGSRLLA